MHNVTKMDWFSVKNLNYRNQFFEQGGKIWEIIKRAGSNKNKQDGKNCENNKVSMLGYYTQYEL